MGEERRKRWSLEGMTALVTGGTEGIGRAVVEDLVRFGAIVHTCARNETKLNQRLQEWRDLGYSVTGSVCEVSLHGAREKLVEEVASLFHGKLNILISTVGIEVERATVEFTAEDYSLVMGTDFETTFHLTQLAHPLLKASRQGSVVLLSSIAGVVAVSTGTLYSASKAALNQFTKNLACEWAKDNIRINSVAPWFTKTEMIKNLLANKDMTERLLARTPVGRFGEAEEVSSMITFLCLPAASYITGQVIAIDGGFSINGFYPQKEGRKEGTGEERGKRWSLQGMTALVTGGTEGIGRAVVEDLLMFGATVHTCARNGMKLNQRLQEWRDLGFIVTGSICDVSLRGARETLMEEVASLFHRKLNILISTVGTVIQKATIEFTDEDYSLVMGTNFETTLHLTQLAHPLLKASGQGSVVLLSSIAGVVAVSAGSLYSASKAALNQFTKNLACEWAKDDIRTNSVAPWITKTEMPVVKEILANKDLTEQLLARTPVGRCGEAEEVSSMITFLCLPAASYITGQVVAIDGGFSINGFYPQ